MFRRFGWTASEAQFYYRSPYISTTVLILRRPIYFFLDAVLPPHQSQTWAISNVYSVRTITFVHSKVGFFLLYRMPPLPLCLLHCCIFCSRWDQKSSIYTVMRNGGEIVTSFHGYRVMYVKAILIDMHKRTFQNSMLKGTKEIVYGIIKMQYVVILHMISNERRLFATIISLCISSYLQNIIVTAFAFRKISLTYCQTYHEYPVRISFHKELVGIIIASFSQCIPLWITFALANAIAVNAHKNRNEKPCIILFLHVILCSEHTNTVKAIIDRLFYQSPF